VKIYFKDIIFLADFPENVHFRKKNCEKCVGFQFARKREGFVDCCESFRGNGHAWMNPVIIFPKTKFHKFSPKLMRFRKISHFLGNGKDNLDTTLYKNA
jgi:hypothetical protein